MKPRSLALLTLSVLAYTQPSFAGFRFNHVIYDCQLDSQTRAGAILEVKASIYEATPVGSDTKQDLAGQWLAAGTIFTKTGRANFMGGSIVTRSWLNPDLFSIKEGPEILEEEPRSLSLSLNTRTLHGELTYKKWNGYAPIGFPDVKITAPIECKKADRYID